MAKFSFTSGGIGKNAIVFGADMSSPVHIDNKNKNILTLLKIKQNVYLLKMS